MRSKFGVAPFMVSILVEMTSSLQDVLNLVTAQSSTVLLTYYLQVINHVKSSQTARTTPVSTNSFNSHWTTHATADHVFCFVHYGVHDGSTKH